VLLTAVVLQAQTLKGVVISSSSPIQPLSSTSQTSLENRNSTMRTFRNDSFLTVQMNINEEEGKVSEINMTPVLRLLSDDYDNSYENFEKYEKESFVKVYVDSFNKQLQSDPFYHVGRDIEVGSFIYEEKSWDALANTLKKKYKVVRVADQMAKKVEKSMTVSYKSSTGTSLKLRPGISRVDGHDTAVARCSMKNIAGIERVETRFGEDCVKVRMSHRINNMPPNSLVALEYESSKETSEAGKTEWNNVSQIVMEIPFW
jgi:hypothetical protein